MDLADLAKRAMHADRKVSGSKDEGGAWIPWIELSLRRSMAVCSFVNSCAVKWANTDGGPWRYIWCSPMVLPKTMRHAAGKVFYERERGSVHSFYASYAWWRGGGEDEGSVSV